MNTLLLIFLVLCAIFLLISIIVAVFIWLTTGFKQTGRMMGGLYVIVGRPGSGKSYIATSIAIQKMLEGKKVFTNFPVVYKDGDTVYCSRYLEKSMLLSQNMNGSVIIEDEAQKDFWSRDFKQFGKDYLMFFSSLNQHEISFYVITQHEDRVDTVINDCANLFGSVEKTEIPFLDMPVFFNLTWWNSETDMQQSAYSDKIECFLAERIWFKREIAQAYDTKFFGTDKRPPYEGIDWIEWYKKHGTEYQGNYDFSPQTRLKNWIRRGWKKIVNGFTRIKQKLNGVKMKRKSNWMQQEMDNRIGGSVEKHDEMKEQNNIDESLFEDDEK